jgi:DNA-binding transcriptional ArsR family regulator
MKPATYFQRSFPQHLLPAITLPEGTTEINGTSAAQPRAFIWPVITKEDHKKSLDNYRSYVQAVNDAVPAVNHQIKRYNKAVSKHTKENPITEGKAILMRLFTSKFNALPDREYNEAVNSFNENHGMYFNKRTFKPIKPVSLQVFEAILHAYAVQLQNFVSVWKKTGKHTATPLPKVEIHPYEISNQERGEGVTNLDVSSRTIRRHRDRLEEAGVLQLKEFRGTSRPVNYFIADAILSVSEGYSPKMQNAENQFFNVSQRTICPHIKVSTGTNRNKKEIKGIVDNSEDRNAPSSLFSNLIFYKTTNPQGAENKTGAAEKNSEKSKPARENLNAGPADTAQKPDARSTQLVDQLETRYDLAQKLANGEFNYYSPLDMKELNQLAALPSFHLSDDDFRDILIQDFAKSAAALNRHNQAGAGSWYIALGDIDTDFGCFNFTGKAQSKHETLKKMVEFRYRLRWALNWFNRREWTNTPFANLYFDPTRTLPTDVSWQYTKKVWSAKMQKIAKAAATKKRKAAEAEKRKAALSTDRKARQKMDNAIYRYLRKELNYTQLTAYAVRELPQKQQEQLGARLQELTLRKLTKNK